MVEKLQIPLPEDNKSLSKAVEDIVSLIDLSNVFCLNKERLDTIWHNAAKKNTEYADKINELYKVTKVAHFKREKYSDRDLKKYSHLLLEKAAEESVIPLLSDIWCYRVPVVHNPTRFSQTLMTTGLAEARNMIGEIRGKREEGRLCEIPRKLTLKEVVSSVLRDKLKLIPTPHPKQGL